MEQVRASYELITPSTPAEGADMIKRIEKIARICYQSQDKITTDGLSAKKLVKFLKNKKHDAMLEFADICVICTVDRGITHEMVRHRLCSFAQESTRFCDYGGKGIQVMLPSEMQAEYDAGTEKGIKGYAVWLRAMEQDQYNYDELRNLGWSPQNARCLLPTCLKSQIAIKANFREWMHIFNMRTPITAHPDMRYIMQQLLEDIRTIVPIIYDPEVL